MATIKMTQKDFFNEIIALAEVNGRDDIVEFCNGRLEVLARKSDNKKPTKTQEENEALKETILATLSNKGMTVTEIQSANPDLNSLSNQKVSALLRQLVEVGKAVKTIDKKKSYFSLPVE